MSATFSELLVHYGYVMIALLLFLEGIGVPIPGETALVTGAALAGRATLSIGWVLASACIGTIMGGAVSYWLGVRGGVALVARFGKVLHIDQRQLDRAHRFFATHGAKAVLIGRFVTLLRSYVGFFAGIARMNVRTFMLYNVIGGIVWSATFAALGFAFGRNLPRLIHDLGRVSLVLALAICIVVVLFTARNWFATRAPELVDRIDARWRRIVNLPTFRILRSRHPLAARYLLSRFARGEYLALHLSVGFVLSLAALGAFAAITEDVVESAPLTRTDRAVAFRLHHMASPDALVRLSHITALGAPLTIALIALGVGIVLLVRRRWIALSTWAAAYAGSVLLDVVLRHIVRRAELPFAAGLVQQRAIGLPTGQSIGTLVTYGLLAHLLATVVPGRVARGGFVTLAVAVVASVVVGRLFLGLGFISTESASAAAGMLWLATTISGLELASSQHPVRLTAEWPVSKPENAE
jgi:membrane protein DedA with SNARE-associated domain